jgi:NTP pyrophosphatase (non-canonical NTP hydrolase)
MQTEGDSPKIQQAFLIHNSGCLITYADAKGDDAGDFDIVAGMLTAIQSFVREAFGAGQWSLKRLEFEDRNLLIELGDYLYLAVIYSGRADAKLQSKVEKVMDAIKERYWLQCKNWTGDMSEWDGSKDMVRALFADEPDAAEQTADGGRKCELCNGYMDESDKICPTCGYDASMYQ